MSSSECESKSSVGDFPFANSITAVGRSSSSLQNSTGSLICVIVKHHFFDVVHDIHVTAAWQHLTNNSIEVIALSNPTKTVTNVANVCNRSAEWVRYHADRGNIPCVQAKIGNRSIRLFDRNGLRIAKKLAGDSR